jgi:Fur family ferric uptake transcriptional regulator/Fur family peroxide stress response transcriptional regulator
MAEQVPHDEPGRALTPQREAVLRVIRASDAHMTAAEIFEAARGLLPGISYATVYNSLRYLKGAGLIAEIGFGNGASRYDRETGRHDHALCTACGRLVDFDLPLPEGLVRAAARRSRFTPHSAHMTLLGICPACRGASKR